MQRWIVFEEEWARTVSDRTHTSADLHLTWDELLTRWGEPIPEEYPEARASFVEALKSTPAMRGDWLSTVEQLREAPLRSTEDIEFCFSHIADNEKNRFLQRLMHLYLSSPLSDGDRVARTSRAIARWQEGHLLETPAEIHFLRARSPSPMFAELQKAVPAISRTALRETWQETEPFPQRFARVALRAPQVTRALDAFADKAAREFARRPNRLQVYFSGSAASRAYLHARLAHHGVRLSDGILDILPFHPLAPSADTTQLVFMEQIPEPPNSLALDSTERHRLRACGYLIPESEPFQERNKERLEGLLRSGPGHAFLFLGGDVPVEGARVHRIADSRSALPSLASNLGNVSIHQPMGVPVIARDGSAPRLSATALKTHADCPARYFYQYQTRLRPEHPVEDQFSLWFGKLVHTTLERAFRGYPREKVTESLLLTLYGEALLENQAELSQSHWMLTALKVRFAPFAKNVPAMEKNLIGMAGGTPERFEEDFEIEYQGDTFRGRIDRMDRLADGSLLVIDYKTGAVDFSPEHIRKGKDFQALLYWMASQKLGTPAGVLFYDLKLGEIRRGWVRSDHLPGAASLLTRGHSLPADKFDALAAQGQTCLTEQANRIRSGDFAPTPSATACEYCEYGSHCRARWGWMGGA